MNEQLRRAESLINAHEFQDAEEILRAELQHDPQNGYAWALLSRIVNDQQRKIDYLERALQFTPEQENDLLREWLTRQLVSHRSSRPPAPEPDPPNIYVTAPQPRTTAPPPSTTNDLLKKPHPVIWVVVVTLVAVIFSCGLILIPLGDSGESIWSLISSPVVCLDFEQYQEGTVIYPNDRLNEQVYIEYERTSAGSPRILTVDSYDLYIIEDGPQNHEFFNGLSFYWVPFALQFKAPVSKVVLQVGAFEDDVEIVATGSDTFQIILSKSDDVKMVEIPLESVSSIELYSPIRNKKAQPNTDVALFELCYQKPGLVQ